MAQFAICAISVFIALHAVELIRLVIDGDDGDRLWGIGVGSFIIITLSYMVFWATIELVQKAHGMVYLISKRDYVSAIDSIRHALDENGIRYEQVEERCRFFILSTPRYTIHLETGGIDIVVTLVEFWKGTVIDIGPVTERNQDETKRIIDILDV